MHVPDAAISPGEIVKILQTWPGLVRMGASIERCEARKVRPTREGELHLEYRLQLLPADAAELAGDRRPVKVTVLGKLYPNGKGQGEYGRLCESLQGKEHLFSEANLNGLLLYEPELRLLLRCPLTDEKLPGLAVALDAEAMKPWLACCMDLVPAGPESIVACAVETLRYKPGKRCTLRYRLESIDPKDGQTHQGSCIGKIYADRQEGEQVFATMVELAALGFGRDAADGIKIPLPYGYVSELQMLLLEDVAGAPLKQSLSSPELAEHLRAAARALAKIHCCSLRVTRGYAVEERLATLQRGVTRAAQICPELAEPFEVSLRRIVGSAAGLRCPEPVLVHRDFQYNQLLVGQESTGRPPTVTIIDFDTLCHGDPAIDVGSFLAHLRWQGFLLAWPEEDVSRHVGAFLAGYDPRMPSELTGRVDFHYRATLLRIACLVSLRPARRHFATALLDEVRAPARWAAPAV
jgi:aminoglycoside phosphotransferase (APT) family kinase protein